MKIYIIVSLYQNISLIIFVKIDSMSGFDIRLVFTFPPKDSTLQYKKSVHLLNNFPCISTLINTMYLFGIVYLSIYLSVFLSIIHLSTYLSIFLSVWMFFCFVSLSIYLTIFLSRNYCFTVSLFLCFNVEYRL